MKKVLVIVGGAIVLTVFIWLIFFRESNNQKAINLVKNAYTLWTNDRRSQEQSNNDKVIRSIVESEQGDLKVIGWKSRKPFDDLYLVEFIFIKNALRRGWAFEVNLEKQLVRDIAEDTVLEQKYGFRKYFFVGRKSSGDEYSRRISLEELVTRRASRMSEDSILKLVNTELQDKGFDSDDAPDSLWEAITRNILLPQSLTDSISDKDEVLYLAQSKTYYDPPANEYDTRNLKQFIDNIIDKKIGALTIEGWKVNRITDSTFLVTYQYTRDNITKGWAFEVNSFSRGVKNIRKNPNLQQKYALDSSFFDQGEFDLTAEEKLPNRDGLDFVKRLLDSRK